jgi:hypothetical protein
LHRGKIVGVGHFGEITDVTTFSSIARLVAGGASRLTAERSIAIQRGEAGPGRARPQVGGEQDVDRAEVQPLLLRDDLALARLLDVAREEEALAVTSSTR